MSENSHNFSFPPVSVVIPNYNGRKLLEKYLPSIVRAATHYRGEVEIIIADDCSTDESVEFVRKNYQDIMVVSTANNCGFLKNSNNGVSAASHDLVVLMNSDVEVESGFIEPLVRHFDDENVFSVTPKAIVPNHLYVNESLTRAVFRDGVLHRFQVGVELEDDSYLDLTQPCLYACAGYSVYDKKKFFALGGFDPLFSPDFAEDFDIGYVAWKAGWKNVYEPDSVVYHESHASISYNQVRELRNYILLTWKNLDDFSLWFRHVAHFVGIFLKSILKRDSFAGMQIEAMRSALPRFSAALRSRRRRKHIPACKSDREILSLLAPPSLSEARHENAAAQLRTLCDPKLREILDGELPGSENHIEETLQRDWHEWLDAYQSAYEDNLAHLNALRDMKADREKYLDNLFGRGTMRMYARCLRARNWLRRLFAT